MYENLAGSEEKTIETVLQTLHSRENQKIIYKLSSNAQTILILQNIPFYFKSALKP